MAEVTAEDARKLLELQDTESSLRRLRHHLENLPEQQAIIEVQEAIEANRVRAAELRLELTEADADVNRHERETKVLRERLGHEQQRLYGGEITNAKEMKSVEAEIAAIQRRVDEHEEAELEVMERQEDLNAQLAETAAKAESGAADLEQAEAARDEAAKETLAAMAELEVRASTQRDDILGDALRLYDKVAARVTGKAVGELKDGNCTACGIALSSIDINELRRGPALGICPCNKEILILHEE